MRCIGHILRIIFVLVASEALVEVVLGSLATMNNETAVKTMANPTAYSKLLMSVAPITGPNMKASPTDMPNLPTLPARAPVEEDAASCRSASRALSTEKFC